MHSQYLRTIEISLRSEIDISDIDDRELFGRVGRANLRVACKFMQIIYSVYIMF